MASPVAQSGVLGCGVPFAQIGSGGRPLVVFDSFRVEHKPAEGLVLQGMRDAYESYVNAGRTVFVVERRGEMPIDYDFDDITGDYVAALAEIAAESDASAGVDVLGIGAGGMFALAAAAQAAGRQTAAQAAGRQTAAQGFPISRLAVVAAADRMTGEARDAAEQWRGSVEELHWRQVHGRMVRWSYGGVAGLFYGALAWLFPELLGTTDYPWDFFITLREIAQADIADRLGQIAVPTLLIAGERDRLFSAELAEAAAARIPKAELLVLPGAGHGLVKTHRREVERRVSRFFEGTA